MKKIIVAFASLALLAGLTACSGTAEPAPTVTVTQTQTVAPTPEPEPTPTTGDRVGAMTDDEFLSFVRSAHPYLNRLRDDQIITLANATCNAFDRGATLEDVSSAIIKNVYGEEAKAYAFVVGSGTRIYCPEHVTKIEG